MAERQALAEVYFLDVGQGSSQVIVFKDRSLVIVDCGKSADALLKLLNTLDFTEISAVVISHWHADHVGGLAGLLKAHGKRAISVHFPQTRPAAELLDSVPFSKLRDFRKTLPNLKFDYLNSNGLDPSIRRVPVGDDNVEIACVFPGCFDAIDAQMDSDPNAGSGVLLLECGQMKVLFPGDVGTVGLQAIHEDSAKSSILDCSISAAPHHSGKLHRSTTMPGFANNFEWLYAKILRPQVLVISVGTSNGNGHPNPDHLAAARTSVKRILCTQITTRCHPAPHALASSLMKDCLPHSACALGDGVGCAGTVHAILYSKRFTIRRELDHRQAVDRLARTLNPLCR